MVSCIPSKKDFSVYRRHFQLRLSEIKGHTYDEIKEGLFKGSYITALRRDRNFQSVVEY